MKTRFLLCTIVVTLFALSVSFTSPPVRADGGAPDLAYVAGASGGIRVIDVGQAKVTKTITVVGDPHTILLSQDGRYLYITQPTMDQVSVIAARTGQTVCSASVDGGPTLLSLDLAANLLFSGGNEANTVSAIDPTNCKVLRQFTTQTPVYGLTLAAPGTGLDAGNSTQLWVSGAQSVTVFNDHTGQLLATIAVPDGPQYLTAPPGDMVYATTRQGSVVAINFQTRKVRPLIAGGQFGPMDYDALTGEVYVPDAQHRGLDVLTPITTSTGALPTEPNRTIPVAGVPESVAITNDGLLGFVALQDGKVAMYDLIDRQLAFTVAVGSTPHFVITGLYPPTNGIVTAPTPETSTPPATQTTVQGVVITIVIVLFAVCCLLALLLVVLRMRKRYS